MYLLNHYKLIINHTRVPFQFYITQLAPKKPVLSFGTLGQHRPLQEQHLGVWPLQEMWPMKDLLQFEGLHIWWNKNFPINLKNGVYVQLCVWNQYIFYFMFIIVDISFHDTSPMWLAIWKWRSGSDHSESRRKQSLGWRCPADVPGPKHTCWARKSPKQDGTCHTKSYKNQTLWNH